MSLNLVETVQGHPASRWVRVRRGSARREEDLAANPANSAIAASTESALRDNGLIIVLYDTRHGRASGL